MRIWFNSNNGNHKALFHNEVSSKEFQNYDEAVEYPLNHLDTYPTIRYYTSQLNLGQH